MHRVGIVVPYRDREEQLGLFVPYLHSYLLTRELDHRIIVVEQGDDKLFNRGSLLNIGFQKAVNIGCDYVVFHDIDMLPKDVDYSYSEVPLELVGKILKDSELEFQFEEIKHLDTYFGGVTLFPVSVFKEINGYSNEYRGWGFEDDDLLRRCLEKGIPLGEKSTRKVAYVGPAAFFDGIRSKLACFLPKKAISVEGRLSSTCSFVVTFQALDQVEQESSIFSIPGLNFTLSLDKYRTLKFECFDADQKPYSVHTKGFLNSDIHQAVVVVTPNRIKLYLDGIFIGATKLKNVPTFFSNKIYLGVGNPNSENAGYFRGRIASFFMTLGEITPACVKDLYLDSNFLSFLSNIGQYSPKHYQPLVYFDAKFKQGHLSTFQDLLGQRNEMIGNDVTVDRVLSPGFYEKYVVPLLRTGTFFSTETDISDEIRWNTEHALKNRKRFEEVCRSETHSSIEGLSTVQDVYSIESEAIIRLENSEYFKVVVVEK